jgi:5'-nucleotidase
LEEQLRDPAPYNVLQLARSLRYTWRASALGGARVAPADVFIDGQPLDLAASCRVAVVSHLASSGDGFDGFARGQDLIDSSADLDTTIDYVRANSPLLPPVLDRITRLP